MILSMHTQHSEKKTTLFLLLCFVVFIFPLVTFAHDDRHKEIVVHMTSEGFEPEELTIEQGDVVLFVQEDEVLRWPASNMHPSHRGYPGSDIKKCNEENSTLFDACAPMQKGDEWEFQFTQNGTWRYHDHINSQYSGSIIVATKDGFVSEGVQIERINVTLWMRIMDIYYTLFPSQLEKRVINISFLETALHEDDLVYWLGIFKPARFMEKLLEETDGGSLVDCHSEAHAVGRASYALFGSAAFSEGNASCHSGYYHGAIEIFIAEKGTDEFASSATSLCDTFDTAFGNYECLHGIGHGVMAYQDYDLPSAIKVCKSLSDSYSSNSCFGGVFMENIVTKQGNGVDSIHETQWLNDDPHFPCKDLEEYGARYQCYLMQTSWMLTLNHADFEEAGLWCSEADESMVSVCYMSLGRDAAGYALRDPIGILERCNIATADGAYREDCVVGGLHVIIDFWGPNLGEQADEFCAIVPEQDIQEKCYAIVKNRKKGFQ
ncbi:MAG: plastocyanin [Acidimicrobiales bacterium]|jgi:plastocyanin